MASKILSAIINGAHLSENTTGTRHAKYINIISDKDFSFSKASTQSHIISGVKVIRIFVLGYRKPFKISHIAGTVSITNITAAIPLFLFENNAVIIPYKLMIVSPHPYGLYKRPFMEKSIAVSDAAVKFPASLLVDIISMTVGIRSTLPIPIPMNTAAAPFANFISLSLFSSSSCRISCKKYIKHTNRQVGT